MSPINIASSASQVSDLGTSITVAAERVLRRIFQHPLSHNLSWRETLALFRAIGTVDHAHNGDTVLKIGTAHQTFKPAHGKDVPADDVLALRHFLTRAGWAPGGGPVQEPMYAPPDLAIVIDHAGARIAP